MIRFPCRALNPFFVLLFFLLPGSFVIMKKWLYIAVKCGHYKSSFQSMLIFQRAVGFRGVMVKSLGCLLQVSDQREAVDLLAVYWNSKTHTEIILREATVHFETFSRTELPRLNIVRDVIGFYNLSLFVNV